jgi:hypothetical protein
MCDFVCGTLAYGKRHTQSDGPFPRGLDRPNHKFVQVADQAFNLRVFLARRTWVARIDIKDVLKLLIVGDSAVRLVERAPRGEKLPKDCPTAKVLLKAKAAALRPERHQSLLSKLSTKREGEAGKRSAGNRIG